jgi:hypothetical protein
LTLEKTKTKVTKSDIDPIKIPQTDNNKKVKPTENTAKTESTEKDVIKEYLDKPSFALASDALKERIREIMEKSKLNKQGSIAYDPSRASYNPSEADLAEEEESRRILQEIEDKQKK